MTNPGMYAPSAARLRGGKARSRASGSSPRHHEDHRERPAVMPLHATTAMVITSACIHAQKSTVNSPATCAWKQATRQGPPQKSATKISGARAENAQRGA